MDQELFEAYMNKVTEGNQRREIRSHYVLDLQDDERFQRIVPADLELFIKNVELDLHDPVWGILLVQSVLGHAQNGHGLFGKEEVKYPQATISDIIAAAGLNVHLIKSASQQLIDEVYTWVELALEEGVQRLTLENKPLFRVRFLSNYVVEPLSALKGFVLAGYMDSHQARKETKNILKQQ